MKNRKVPVFFLLVHFFIIAHFVLASGVADPFGQSYLQLRETFYQSRKSSSPELLIQLLDQVKKEADSSPGSPYVDGALIWVAQAYSETGKPELAEEILSDVLKKDISPKKQEIVMLELGIAQQRAGKNGQAEETFLTLARDPDISPKMKGAAADKVRTLRMVGGDKASAK